MLTSPVRDAVRMAAHAAWWNVTLENESGECERYVYGVGNLTVDASGLQLDDFRNFLAWATRYDIAYEHTQEQTPRRWIAEFACKRLTLADVKEVRIIWPFWSRLILETWPNLSEPMTPAEMLAHLAPIRKISHG